MFRRMDPRLKLAIFVAAFVVLIVFPIVNSYVFGGSLGWARIFPPR